MRTGIKWTEEQRKNFIKKMKGKKRTDDQKKRYSLSKLGSKNPSFGKKPWNYGKHWSKEMKDKLSSAHKGQVAWHKGKKLPELSGKNSPHWKGGLTPLNKLIRGSLEYRLWRESVFKRDNYTCIWCGIRGNQTGGYLEADHIKPFAYFPELRFAIDNGRTLCKPCHKLTDTYAGKIKNYNN